ncbi:MAG: OmpA family protein, partial [Gammaproteobacteria bacterium]|nr:OmpA family protein [Gammaproteobacteria bacterium]
SEAGFEPIFSGGPKEIDKYNFMYKHPVEILDKISIGNEIFYLVSRKNISGIDVYLSVLVSPHSGGDGQRVRIIAAETTPMKLQMVDAAKMQLDITETGRTALYGIYFDHDSAKIQAASKPTLDEIAKLMKTNPALKIIVVGHTDYTGGFDYNINLSKRRANAVAARLISGYGLEADRIKSDGVGYLAPAASNETEAGRALNRRVELVKDK